MTAAWFAVHTQPQAESTAAAHLARQGLEVFLPRFLKRRRHARRVDMVPSPLFPRYLFVRVDTQTQRWRSINGTMGVKYVLSEGDRPLEVPAAVIARIRDRQGEDGWIRLETGATWSRGDAVTIAQGPLEGLNGLFEDLDDQERVVVLLTLMGRSVKVRVPLDTVKPSA